MTALYITQNSVLFACTVLLIHSFMETLSNRSMFGAWMCHFFGIFLHECAHYLVGAILWAKPKKFILFPHCEIDSYGRKSYTLGQVQFANLKWHNTFPTAMAPLFLLVIAFWVEKHFWEYFEQTEAINEFLYVYILIVLVKNAIPSSVDFQSAFKNTFGLIFWALILSFFIKYYNIIVDYFINLL